MARPQIHKDTHIYNLSNTRINFRCFHVHNGKFLQILKLLTTNNSQILSLM